MPAFPNAFRLRLLTVVVVGLNASQCANASESPTKMGQVAYTAGTGTVQTGQSPTGASVISSEPARDESAQWQTASLEIALASMPLHSASFQEPSRDRLEAEAGVSDRASISETTAAGKPLEPGSWAAALSTLSLAMFFFLRRLG